MTQPILIVEDDASIRDMLVDCLADAELSAVAVAHAPAALELLRNGLRPRLVLLDLAMPMMSGQEFLRIMHCDPDLAHTPVMVLTAGQRERAAALGVSQVLTKPFGVDELLAAVARSLGTPDPTRDRTRQYTDANLEQTAG